MEKLMAEARPRAPGVEGRAGRFPGPSLIPALTAIQERAGWLPREELVALSREVRRPLYEIEGLVSFYPHFRTDPPTKVELSVCHDLTCWLRGSEEGIARLRERHGADADIEIVERSCIGRCDIAPAASVNEIPVAADDADAKIAEAKLPSANGHPNGTRASREKRWPNDPYQGPDDRYGVVKAVLAGERDTARIIAALKDAGLRGMGGAGFPAGRKWDLVASAGGGDTA